MLLSLSSYTEELESELESEIEINSTTMNVEPTTTMNVEPTTTESEITLVSLEESEGIITTADISIIPICDIIDCQDNNILINNTVFDNRILISNLIFNLDSSLTFQDGLTISDSTLSFEEGNEISVSGDCLNVSNSKIEFKDSQDIRSNGESVTLIETDCLDGEFELEDISNNCEEELVYQNGRLSIFFYNCVNWWIITIPVSILVLLVSTTIILIATSTRVGKLLFPYRERKSPN